MEITQENRKWLDDLQLTHPVVIAGPCSAETQEQVLSIAHSLKDTDESGNHVPALECLKEWEL